MKKFCFFTVALVVLLTSCSTSKYYPVPEEYRNYSETIEITGKDVAEIYRKTELWVTEQTWETEKAKGSSLKPVEGLISIAIISKSEREIKIVLLTDRNHGNLSGNSSDGDGKEDNGNTVYFNIENDRCQLKMRHGKMLRTWGKKYVKAYAIEWLDLWKKYADAYRAYITRPILSQAEINVIIAKGNTAFTARKYSEAEKYYSEALEAMKYAAITPNSVIINAFIALGDAAFTAKKFSDAEKYYRQALANAIPNADKTDLADMYVALGLAIESQVSDPSQTERFVIDTNKINRVFKEKVEEGLKYESMQTIIEAGSGYGDESYSLDKAYEADTGKLNSALEMYNKALSLDPKNETASGYAAYANQRKASISSSYSRNRTTLDNMGKIVAEEKKKAQDMLMAKSWEKIAQTANQVAAGLARIQQNRNNTGAGDYSGGGQASSSSSSSGSSGRTSSSSAQAMKTCTYCHGSKEVYKSDEPNYSGKLNLKGGAILVRQEDTPITIRDAQDATALDKLKRRVAQR